MKRTKLTDAQLDRMIDLADREIELMRGRLGQLGMTEQELDACMERADAKAAAEWGTPEWRIQLGGASYKLAAITGDGNATLLRAD